MSDKTFHGVPRCKIPWYPTIEYEKSLACGKCVDYCKLGVYQFDEEDGKKTPLVKNPNNCVVYCNGCDAICPTDAIKHPSIHEIGKIIGELRKNKT